MTVMNSPTLRDLNDRDLDHFETNYQSVAEFATAEVTFASPKVPIALARPVTNQLAPKAESVCLPIAVATAVSMTAADSLWSPKAQVFAHAIATPSTPVSRPSKESLNSSYKRKITAKTSNRSTSLWKRMTVHGRQQPKVDSSFLLEAC
jgi:hypothetical protein